VYKPSIKLTLTIFLLIFVHEILHSQSFFRQINGRVIDTEGAPLPFTHVYLDTETGTITNDSGYFRLNIPISEDKYLKATLIGYEKDSISVTSLKEKEQVIFQLSDSKSLLESVTVSAERERDSSYVILNLVLQNLSKNYPTKRYSMEAFYRESSINDTTYSRLVEGTFLISDKGYNKPSDDTRIQKLHLRKTEDFRNLDWRKSLTEWLYRKNGVYTLLQADRLKKLESPNFNFLTNSIENYETLKKAEGSSFRFLSQQFIDSTSFYIDKIVKEDEDTYYIIRYRKRPKYSLIFSVIVHGEIKVNKSDWAIVNWSSRHVLDENGVEERIKKGNPGIENYQDEKLYQWHINRSMDGEVFRSINYLYSKNSNGKYYLQYINHKTTGSLNSSMQSESFDQSFNSDFSEGNIYTTVELEVTKIKKYEKISWLDNLDANDQIYELSPTKSYEFWETTNYVSLVNLSAKMIRDLSGSDEQEIKFIDE